MFAFHEDHRVIFTATTREGLWQVHAQRHEVMWRDGTTCHLHPVALNGVPQTFLRVLHHEALCWLITDLRHHSAEIEGDILRLLPRDTPRLVMFTLRGAYRTARAFTDGVAANPRQQWWAPLNQAAAA